MRSTHFGPRCSVHKSTLDGRFDGFRWRATEDGRGMRENTLTVGGSFDSRDNNNEAKALAQFTNRAVGVNKLGSRPFRRAQSIVLLLNQRQTQCISICVSTVFWFGTVKFLFCFILFSGLQQV